MRDVALKREANFGKKAEGARARGTRASDDPSGAHALLVYGSLRRRIAHPRGARRREQGNIEGVFIPGWVFCSRWVRAARRSPCLLVVRLEDRPSDGKRGA